MDFGFTGEGLSVVPAITIGHIGATGIYLLFGAVMALAIYGVLRLYTSRSMGQRGSFWWTLAGTEVGLFLSVLIKIGILGWLFPLGAGVASYLLTVKDRSESGKKAGPE